ncbi:hypothetical protein [Ruminococcus albus]|uniref:Uncharacterized protein n=1 Tax=Ruminococcus albus (strain ATCC 27210 / DSM 20455 / JCM 14654 / NCDO 2250 / 7) TaxID=697329 RepID=E6UKF8_RUMA7|nr:hypothetical protein [Ruminococcus albus]ADU24154.1 hypothetical protein Rumal_3717 [Ruminococcus albus 7 = DSM 20455]
MVKKNVLTPVLAGVLGVAVVGSGVGYFVLNKNADKASSEKSKNQSSVVVSPKLSVMAENITNTIDKATEIAKGDVDYAYSGSFNISFGPAITKNMPTAPKDFGMTVSSKQKGGNEGGDIELTYGGQKVVTVNQVYSRENSEEMYVRVPELSEAYIKVNRAEAESYLKDSVGIDFDQYAQTAQNFDFDTEAFEADIKEYEQLVKDNFPEAKENGTKSGDIDGVSYEYTSKSYELTAADGQKVVTAVLEKAKTDENFKKLYEQGVEAANQQSSAMYEKYGEEAPSTPSYEEAIDKMLEEVKGEIKGEETVMLETYENSDGQFAGFNLKPSDEKGELKFISVSNENAEGLDISFDSGDGTAVTAYGALKSENDVVNGTYTVTSTDDGEENMKVVYTMTDMKNVGENFAGTIRFDVSVNEDGTSDSIWMEVKSDSTADDLDVTFDIGLNGENAFTMKMTGEKTEASDVDVPGSDVQVFNALDEEQMNKYLETCDTEGFMNKLKENLGDEMYNSLFGSSSSSSYSSGSSSDDDDFDWEAFENEYSTESTAEDRA